LFPEALILFQFEKKQFTVPYKHVDQTFEIQMCNPWDWAIDIVTDPMIAPRIIWDAQIQSSWNGEEWEHFFTEPWTAKLFWEAQVFLCLWVIPLSNLH
jgi:hypothetical protein